MVVGLAVWDLQLPGCRSLKEKRAVVKSLKDRLHGQFNVSVAETKYHDRHGRAELAACVVATDQPQANRTLDAADRLVEEEWRARLVDAFRTYY